MNEHDEPAASQSQQDGQDPELRSDMINEIANSKRRLAARPKTGRAQNREIENEMISNSPAKGRSPRSATQPK